MTEKLEKKSNLGIDSSFYCVYYHRASWQLRLACTTTIREITLIQNIAPTSFVTPLKYQNQIVEVSYLMDGDRVWRRIHNRSDNSYTFYSSIPLKDDDGNYYENPPKNRRWRKEPHY